MPLHGVSMAYAFDDAAAPEARETQYFEMFCNRGIYHKGWTAVTRHSVPWEFDAELPALDDDVWELYDTSTDWTQAHDLAAEHPDKLAELQRLWLIEAVKYNVLPLDDRRIERFNSDLAGRPVLVKGNTQILYGGMGRLSENSVLNLKNKSHAVSAQLEIPDGGGQRRDHRPGRSVRRLVRCTCTRAGPSTATTSRACSASTSKPTPRSRPASTSCGWSSPTTAAASPRAACVTLYVDGDKVGEGRVEATVPMIYSGDETCDLGCDVGTPVSEDYTGATSRFNGKVKWVQLDAGLDDHDHLITAEERFRVAMAIQ